MNVDNAFDPAAAVCLPVPRGDDALVLGSEAFASAQALIADLFHGRIDPLRGHGGAGLRVEVGLRA